jgi:glucose/mannose-6-phosphate isomerase
LEFDKNKEKKLFVMRGRHMLDEVDNLRIIDVSGMLDILYKVPEQIVNIATVLKDFSVSELAEFEPDKIIIVGMGGSAMGGDMLAAVLSLEAKIPIITVRDYTIPSHANSKTLVFACSYSGNTEETLSAVDFALDRKCKIIGITSGGKLEKLCNQHGLPLFSLPTGLPPRAAIIYLFFPLAVILEKLKIVNIDVEISELVDTLIELRDSLAPEVPSDENPAKILAKNLSNSIPVIYGHSYLNAIATRWKTQLNENAKMLAHAGMFPEMNHNEIVGWSEAPEDMTKLFKVILLRSADEHPQVSKRIELTKNTLVEKAGNVFEVDAMGNSKLTRMLSTMYLGDYISVYLALLRQLDPTPVTVIEELKEKLAE